MAHAEKCPVCSGTGKIRCDPNTAYLGPKKICHGCNGKGWVEIEHDNPPVVPWERHTFPMLAWWTRYYMEQ